MSTAATSSIGRTIWRAIVSLCILVGPLPVLLVWTATYNAPIGAEAPPDLRVQPPQLDMNYPRLANYNGFQQAADVLPNAHDGLVIAPQWADQGSPSPVQRLEEADPNAVVLVYQRTLQVDYPLIRHMYGTTDIYPGWWLLRAGSVLAAAISASQTVIPVVSSARFHRFDDVLVDGESMHVLAVSAHTLTVQRGFYSTAGAHAAGARIAAHYSYRVDLRNSIVTGKWENRRPWSFNLSTQCPRDRQGHTFSDFLIAFMGSMLRHGHWHGVFFDNTDDMPRDAWLDVNNDNTPDGGVLNGNNVWHDGELALLRALRARFPRAVIMDNGTLDAGLASNGREMEGFPLYNSFYMPAMNDYAYWQRHDAKPSLVLVNPDTTHSPRFDLRAMRFGLASALMGDGFYSYDEGWHKHGVVWNFDEYDGGVGSAVLRDIGKQDTYIRVRDTWRFHGGDLVVVGREEMRVRDLGSWNLIVQRGVNGTAATTHPAGSVVATPAQLAAGAGYLGQPTGAPFPLIPAPQTPNLIAGSQFNGQGSSWTLSVLHPSSWHITEKAMPTELRVAGQSASAGSHAATKQALVLHDALHTVDGYSLTVPWQALRKAAAVSLEQTGIHVRPATAYTLSFQARGVAGMTLPILITGQRPGGRRRYASFSITLHQGWYRYTLRYTPPSGVHRIALAFQFGHTYGSSAIHDVALQAGQGLVFARAFQHGLAIVNQGDTATLVHLPRTYWHLRGDQDPALNNGQPVRTLVLPPYAGMILLNAPPT